MTLSIKWRRRLIGDEVRWRINVLCDGELRYCMFVKEWFDSERKLDYIRRHFARELGRVSNLAMRTVLAHLMPPAFGGPDTLHLDPSSRLSALLSYRGLVQAC